MILLQKVVKFYGDLYGEGYELERLHLSFQHITFKIGILASVMAFFSAVFMDFR